MPSFNRQATIPVAQAQRAHSLLARQHEMGDAIPVTERLFGVLENRSGEAREPKTVRSALAALPVKRLVAGGVAKIVIARSASDEAIQASPHVDCFASLAMTAHF